MTKEEAERELAAIGFTPNEAESQHDHTLAYSNGPLHLYTTPSVVNQCTLYLAPFYAGRGIVGLYNTFPTLRAFLDLMQQETRL